jgi:hypothetical protein
MRGRVQPKLLSPLDLADERLAKAARTFAGEVAPEAICL